MTDRPKIPVVAPSFNSVTTIRDTIESVLRQGYKEFLNAADYEFKLRLGRSGCRVGHVPEFLVDYLQE